MTRTRLVVLFGGSSSEHEISIRSARSVLAAIDPERFEAIPVGIRRDRQWRRGEAHDALEWILNEGHVVGDPRSLAADLVFPVLHGPYGEDGTIQGLLEMLGVAYVGSGVLASATCMDKAVQKFIVHAAAPTMPLVPWVALDRRTMDADACERVLDRAVRELGFPCFCKPANLGSSVGVVKCEDLEALRRAIVESGRYDHKLVIERGIDAREIEVAVLGNGGPETTASTPGEIGLPEGTWYDYDTKYTKDVARYLIPAPLAPTLAERIREHALTAFRALGCEGLARVDFLLDRNDDTPYLNEVNTMPGFTSISMYPKLILHDGTPYADLVTRLCELGLSRHRERSHLSIEP